MTPKSAFRQIDQMFSIQIEEPASRRSIELGRGAECQWTHHDGPEHGQLDIPRLAERPEETLGAGGNEPIGHPFLGRFYLNRRLNDHEIAVMSGTQFRGHGVADGSGFAKISGFNVIRDVQIMLCEVVIKAISRLRPRSALPVHVQLPA